MNHEQIAFFNQQLAGMLKSGIPLEASLKQLAASMGRGEWRTEIERLEADLEQGVPIDEALGRRKLPEVYVSMLRAGVRSNDLPGVLTLAADYYTNLHTTWLRLKGLLVYPGLVLVTSLIVSTMMAVIYTSMVEETANAFGSFLPGKGQPSTTMLVLQVWFPVALLALTTCAFFLVLSLRSARQFARWRLPGFREASLSQLASTIAVMLENGADFGTALDVAQRNESSPYVRGELAQWRARLANGAKRFTEIATPGKLLPPLFVWLVTGAGENWARGFRRAAQAYDARARYRMDLFLYAALPVTILFVAALIATEMAPLIRSMSSFMTMMSDVGGD
ncbi:MAG TPA: type II secretion system F family protein [Candidatus Acidoferrum sp.]|nr:type II secretion system F family protein [Candidatus Acidoferrum sp.]